MYQTQRYTKKSLAPMTHPTTGEITYEPSAVRGDLTVEDGKLHLSISVVQDPNGLGMNGLIAKSIMFNELDRKFDFPESCSVESMDALGWTVNSEQKLKSRGLRYEMSQALITEGLYVNGSEEVARFLLKQNPTGIFCEGEFRVREITQYGIFLSQGGSEDLKWGGFVSLPDFYQMWDLNYPLWWLGNINPA